MVANLSQFSAQSSCPKGAPGVVAVAEWGGHGGSDTPPPLGPSLRPLDLEFMKHPSKVVNIIPQATQQHETMTLEEKSEFKQRVRRPPPPSPVPMLASPSGPSPHLSSITIPTYPTSHLAPTQLLERLGYGEEKLVHQPSQSYLQTPLNA